MYERRHIHTVGMTVWTDSSLIMSGCDICRLICPHATRLKCDAIKYKPLSLCRSNIAGAAKHCIIVVVEVIDYFVACVQIFKLVPSVEFYF